MTSNTLTLAFLGSLAYIALRWIRPPKELPFPPGPPADPLIGHLRILPLENQAEVFRLWSEQYGNLIHVTALGRHLIVIGDARTAMDLLEKRSANYSDRPRILVAEILGSDDLPFMHYGDEFRKQRKMVHTFLTKKACAEYMPLQRQNAHTLVVNLSNHPGRHETCLNTFATGAVISVICGDQIHSIDDPWVKIMETHNEIEHHVGRPGGSPLDVLPILQYFPSWFPGTGDATYCRKNRPLFQRVFTAPIQRVQAQLAEGRIIPSIISKEISRLLEREFTTDEDLIDVGKAVGSMLHAGNETTWITLSTFLLVMTVYPNIQHRAQKEIDAIIRVDRLPEYSDHDSLPYVAALIQELLRWNPAVPLGIPHRAMDDDTYNGYSIPKGAIVIPNAYGMSRDESVYQDPTTFDPTRFLPRPEGRAEPLFDQVAFGFGRRICPGRHFAYNSLWIAITTCLATLRIGRALDGNGKEIIPECKFFVSFLSRPKPFKCKITARETFKHLGSAQKES